MWCITRIVIMSTCRWRHFTRSTSLAVKTWCARSNGLKSRGTGPFLSILSCIFCLAAPFFFFFYKKNCLKNSQRTAVSIVQQKLETISWFSGTIDTVGFFFEVVHFHLELIFSHKALTISIKHLKPWAYHPLLLNFYWEREDFGLSTMSL